MTKQLNKKGTSLVELIAVIVIMGIIAGIAIPTTIGVINRQRKNAAKSSALTVFTAAKQLLIEASAGDDVEGVTVTGSGDSKTWTTTAKALASTSNIEKNPFDDSDSDGMTIVYNGSTYNVTTNSTINQYTISVKDGTNNTVNVEFDATKA